MNKHRVGGVMADIHECTLCGGPVEWVQKGIHSEKRLCLKSLCLKCGEVNAQLVKTDGKRLKEIRWCWTVGPKVLIISVKAKNIYEGYITLTNWDQEKIKLNETWIEINGRRI